MPGKTDIPGTWIERIHTPAMTGATADYELPLLKAESNLKIVGANWVPSAAVTHDATNFTTIAVRNRTTGAGAALPATRSYAATDSVAQVAEAMTLSATAADLLVAKGDVLTVQALHSGTGVVVPAGAFELFYQYR